MFNHLIMKRDGETQLEYKFRMIKLKLEGDLEMGWEDLRDLLGLECSPDHLRKTAYGIYEAVQYYETKDISELPHHVIQEIEEKQQELYKERVKLSDIRRENRNETRKLARMEVLLEEYQKHFDLLEPLFKPELVKPKEGKDIYTGVALCSDWHIGGNVDNLVNKYNVEIARQSVMKYAQDVIAYGKFHNLKKVIVANLGDMFNGTIHISTRVNNEINIIEQVMTASELMSDFVATLAYQFEEIEVINVIGNHGRTEKNKENAILAENFERLIPWYMEQRLRDFENVTIETDKDGIVLKDIQGQKIAFTHGDRDRLGNAGAIAQALGISLNYIIMGHYHHKQEKDLGISAELIVARSMIGSDEYALGIRKTSKAGQTFLIFGVDGVVAEYNTIFNRKPKIEF